ncbi:DUF2268 domain-containing putative Zn-dependent protease [Halocalculus aciditolerans]|uniref:DUF2268 domain-containing protein n=1 Tax=Halocalculus aciditolerans TaxID=1383812 RepID=A0A830FAF5_9EURY|nr:DUF2268 domain-containing putative Zn-dependent protease [Halocalculus aciditolerans]GGL70272.1 hypothetical protein GCM10009039_30420 [Halocalculus aciditolerans]
MADRLSPTTAEFREARGIIERSLAAAEARFPTETDVVVEIGWAGDDDIVDILDGAYGFASYPNRIEIEFNTAAPNWQASLKSTTAHEYAHVWGFERRGRESETKWEYVVEEAVTQHAAKQLVPEYQSPWWTRYNPETVAEYWDRIRAEELDRDSEDGGTLYVEPKDSGYPFGLGYSLSFQLGRTLLEEHDLPYLLDIDKSALVAAGDRLYRDD